MGLMVDLEGDEDIIPVEATAGINSEGLIIELFWALKDHPAGYYGGRAKSIWHKPASVTIILPTGII